MRVPIAAPTLPDDPDAPRPTPAPALGTGTRVWLVRHADVHDDWQERAYGALDVPLSDAGLRQTEAMSRRFGEVNVASVASSNLMRALRMGTGIAEVARAPLSIDARLREVSRGEWQGLPTAEFRARWAADAQNFRADPWHWKAHKGESDADLFARGWPVVLQRIRERVESAHAGDVVIASHFNLIRALVTGALGWPGHTSFGFRTETARACLLVDMPAGWALAARNVDDPRTVGAPAPGR